MAITFTAIPNGTFDTNTGAKTCTAFTPAASELLVVVSAWSATINDPTISDSLGGSWTKIIGCTRAGNASAMTAWVRDAFPAQSSMTVTATPNGGTETGGGLRVLRWAGAGAAGISIVKQSAQTTGIAAGGAVSVAMGSAILTGNAVIGAINSADNPPTPTLPTGFTNRASQGHTAPAAGLRLDTADNGITVSTVSWGGTSTGNACALVVELDASVVGAVALRPPVVVGQRSALIRASGW